MNLLVNMHTAARRLDERLRDFSPRGISGGAARGGLAERAPELAETLDVHGTQEIEDHWQRLNRDGYVQEENRVLVRPLVFYPGNVVHLAPPKRWMTVEPRRVLWARLSWRLGRFIFQHDSGPATTGTSGRIMASNVTLLWQAANENLSPQNQIFPSTMTDSMPPGDTLVWHGTIASTDAAGVFAWQHGAGLRYDGGAGMVMPDFS